MGIPTQISIRVLAVGGKYLGNDIGGAMVSLFDVHTNELLASGVTSGGSGSLDLMTVSLTRAQILPVDDASVFNAILDLEEPCLIKITAFGPLAFQNSANTVSTTLWVYPGRNITGDQNNGGIFLEIPGLAVQILNPPTHFLPQTAPTGIEIRANVTMMCGCPIGPGHSPWLPELFEVNAVITGTNYVQELPLNFDNNALYGAPSQFANNWSVPENTSGESQIYKIVVSAFQPQTGNTGVDTATVIIPAASN